MSGLTRRQALRNSLWGAASCACCISLARNAVASGGPAWSYGGKTGPEAWGSLDDGYQACSVGTTQSPIDLTAAIPAEIPAADLDWTDLTGPVVNNGHTIQVNASAGSSLSLAGTRYDLLQFHFHHPSEHLIDGEALAMEVHFVHKSAAGNLAVVGVLFREGAENAALAPIWATMPRQASEGPQVTVSPAAFLPADRSQFRYAGSLTTPPCSEIVTWIAYKTPIEASRAQIEAFATLFPMNARPAQPLHRRFLLLGGG